MSDKPKFCLDMIWHYWMIHDKPAEQFYSVNLSQLITKTAVVVVPGSNQSSLSSRVRVEVEISSNCEDAVKWLVTGNSSPTLHFRFWPILSEGVSWLKCWIRRHGSAVNASSSSCLFMLVKWDELVCNEFYQGLLHVLNNLPQFWHPQFFV